MTVSQMIGRGYTLDRIEREIRRQVFSVVLKQEKRKARKGAKVRTAQRLGIHRNTVSREIWRTPIQWERDPPVSKKELYELRSPRA